MIAGWAAIAAAVLTVAGLVTLLAFFATTNAILGALNDLITVGLAAATVPIALALHPVASRASAPLATAAVAADLVGVALAAGFSLLLVTGAMTFQGTLAQVSAGNALIGSWLALTAVLLLVGAAVPVPLGVLGVVGGAGLLVTSVGFPLLGPNHPVVGVAGLCSLVGLVGFYAWTGVLMLQGGLGRA